MRAPAAGDTSTSTAARRRASCQQATGARAPLVTRSRRQTTCSAAYGREPALECGSRVELFLGEHVGATGSNPKEVACLQPLQQKVAIAVLEPPHPSHLRFCQVEAWHVAILT